LTVCNYMLYNYIMNKTYVGSFESRTKGTVDVFRGYDDATAAAIYAHASDPGITRTLGSKDVKRFSPDTFLDWAQKGGGRYLYNGWNADNLAALFWVGGEPFPKKHFPKSSLQPPYTAAWRTGYSTPEGGTFEGEGIGKRLALAGIADVVALTRNGGPQLIEDGKTTNLPPLQDTGLWLDTGIWNTDGQNLYHHLGNTSREQAPRGFKDVGIYTPPFTAVATPLEIEPRVGMVADAEAIARFVEVAAALIDFAQVGI
jgi:hypothetical protein